jgi:NAD(P)-dependent dehydrogenase (short-subunit alcohol dehydrogenase family)
MANRRAINSIYVAMTNNRKQTALITGASSGIGLGLTIGFLAEGFNVVANSRHVTAAGTLTPSGELLLVDGDVGEASTARNLIKSAEQRFGRVDVLINNAGIFVPKPFVEYTPEDFQRVVSTNLAGFFYVSQEAARHMQQNGGGQIINITTTLAQQPVAGVAAALTSLTKGGLNSVTRGLAIEYAAEGIRVNAIAPGIVDTPMHKPENHESLKRLHPIARLATVQEIVEATLFLVRAPFITGEVLYVDGGAHAGRW